MSFYFDQEPLFCMSTKPTFRVVFQNHNNVYELYARAVYQSEMYGFIEVEEFVFGERSNVIVDPSEEKLKNEFADVTRSYIPLHNLIRIDEVEKEGVATVTEVKAGDKIMPFPTRNSKKPNSDDS